MCFDTRSMRIYENSVIRKALFALCCSNPIYKLQHTLILENETPVEIHVGWLSW